MGETTTIETDNPYQIHKARRVETHDSTNDPTVEDLGPIEEHELPKYNGLEVEDITDERSFEQFDSGNRLLKTQGGELLIVHHRVVPTGPWDFLNKN